MALVSREKTVLLESSFRYALSKMLKNNEILTKASRAAAAGLRGPD
jgi:hypothetical protein